MGAKNRLLIVRKLRKVRRALCQAEILANR